MNDTNRFRRFTTQGSCPILAPFRMDQATNKCWIGKDSRDDFGTYERPESDELIKMARSSSVSLYVRQQPKEALVTVDGKEKCMAWTINAIANNPG